MEILLALLVWPFLLVAIFLVGLSFATFDLGYIVLLIVFFLILLSLFSKRPTTVPPVVVSEGERLARVREIAIVFCISLFLPLFARYLVNGFDNSLWAVVLALAVGFGVLLWGLFLKNNKALVYANIIGGSLTILYCYFEIWSLGQFAKVIATAFGLCIAVAFSIIKLKEKLK